MTEDEAKTKACCGPFAGRMPYGDAGMAVELQINGLDPQYAAETAARWPCIASACMAWRAKSDPAANLYSEALEIYRERNGRFVPGGHCGLAGAPQ